MKLIAMTEKVSIKWFVYSMGVKLPRTSSMRGSWDGYDFECSCGYASKTGGALKSVVSDILDNHKRYEHNYEYRAARLNSGDFQAVSA
jgi:hypothetical protein